MFMTSFQKPLTRRICIFVFCAFDIYGNIMFNILEQSSFQRYTTYYFWKIDICCICVFVIFVFVLLTYRNIIFDILEQSSFQWYTTCWVFLALCHMLYLCICVFVICVFTLLTFRNIIFDIFEQSSFQWYITYIHCGSFWLFIICCFVYLYLCICVRDTNDYTKMDKKCHLIFLIWATKTELCFINSFTL